jgi:predicted NUDIX family NTP pyrophosphohydrolase
MYRRHHGRLEVLLAHPGGPFFRNKDVGAWTLPKGEPLLDEPLEQTARREFQEETGLTAGPALLSLGEVKQKAGKTVHGWAFEGDLPADFVLRCNQFELEWPPRSGQRQAFPEVDRVAFFGLDEAREKINPAQVAFLERLQALVQSG